MERDLFLAALIKNGMKNVEEKIGYPRYGVSGVGGSAAALTRLWDAVGLTAQVGTDGDNSAVVNDFDTIAPFNRRKCVGSWSVVGGRAVFTPQAYYGDADYTEDGSKGDYVCVDQRPVYWYQSEDGNILGVSPGPREGFILHDACKDRATGNVREHTYLPCYALGLKNGKAVSLPGLNNRQGSYVQLWNNARTYADADAAAFTTLEPSAVNHLEYLLMTVEFATQDMQTVMNGAVSLRWGNNETYTALTATTGVTNYTGYTEGQQFAIYTGTADVGSADKYGNCKLVSQEPCDEDGTPNASGTFRLLTIEMNEGEAALETGTTYKIVTRAYLTGACNGVGTPSGSPVSNADGKHPMRYRYRENVYGNQNRTCHDLFDKRVLVEGTEDEYTLEWYFMPDPLAFAPKNPSEADLNTYCEKLAVTQETYANGYITKEAADPKFPCVPVPVKTTGGSASTFFCDYAYLVYSYVVRSVRRGGTFTDGASSGPSYVHANAAPSSGIAYYGGGLFFAQ